MTTVISLRVNGKIDLDLVRKCKEDPNYIYIGRENRTYGLQTSFWANPFKPQNYKNPQDCLEAYRAHIEPHFTQFSGVLETQRALANVILVCWCKPGPCHGDVLIELLKNELE